MRKTPTFLLLLAVLAGFQSAYSQRRANRPAVRAASAKGFVTDERLAAVRELPDAESRLVMRLRRGRQVAITGTTMRGDVGFYRVTISKNRSGWIQREAIASANRPSDDERLANLIAVSDGFERAQRARIFLDVFPKSPRRAEVLLAFGDAVDAAATKISRDSRRKFTSRTLNASEAPVRTFFLNVAALDRYRRLGASFTFDETSRSVRYDGACWREIVERFPRSETAVEARKRLGAASAPS